MKINLREELYNSKLDKVLLAELPHYSRNQILKMIKNGGVTVNSEVVTNRNRLLKRGDFFGYETSTLEANKYSLEAEDIKLNILYEDDDLIVIDKQVGLVVHPGAGNWTGTVLNAVLFHDKNCNPVAINRLDKETSGVMFVAKNSESKKYYSQLFEERSVYKKYICIVPIDILKIWVNGENGKFRWETADTSLRINVHGYIDRHPVDRKKMFFYNFDISSDFDKRLFLYENKKNPKLKKSSRFAESEISVLEKYDSHVKLEVILKTGRKHQIRAQMKALNSPIVGDKIYQGEEHNRMLLHSYETIITLKNGLTKHFIANLPEEFN